MEQLSALDRYRSSLGGVEVLEPALERELAARFRTGDGDAGRRLVEASLPFVIRIAREYRRWGAPLEDLVQQGNLGLLKAAKKYDPERACRLITYAAYWIRAEIREHVVRTYRIVRLGTTRTERKAMRTYRRLNVESAEELAERSGMPLARAEKLWPLLCGHDVSLDVQYGDRGPGVDRLSDESPSPEDLLSSRDEIEGVRGALEAALSRLSDRERHIVQARFMKEDPPTLEQLGHELGVSKERVRQLEARACQKLRGELAVYRPAA